MCKDKWHNINYLLLTMLDIVDIGNFVVSFDIERALMCYKRAYSICNKALLEDIDFDKRIIIQAQGVLKEKIKLIEQKNIEEKNLQYIKSITTSSKYDAENASKLNIEYQKKLDEWNRQPLWKRVLKSKPERPKGI